MTSSIAHQGTYDDGVVQGGSNTSSIRLTETCSPSSWHPLILHIPVKVN